MLVLLIDDDPISRVALSEALRPLRHLQLLEVDSARTAWDGMAAGRHPALCCCDVRMPDMTGIELVQHMREDPRLHRLPVLLVSSAADRHTVSEGIMLGIGGFLVKPFQAADLRAKVRALLGPNLETCFELRQEAMKRLGITSSRYAQYMEALAGQMDNAAATLRAAAALDAGLLDTLHTGCLTLGAHYGAGVIEGLKRQLPSGYNERMPHDLMVCARALRDRAAGEPLNWY